MNEFKSLKKSRRFKLKHFEELLNESRTIIKHSSMFNNLNQALEPYVGKIDRVRCLAIGSFHEDVPSRYQLALLLELLDFLQFKDNSPLLCSIYDPVFTQKDKLFIEKMGLTWTVDEKPRWNLDTSCNTLFFLPHAPLDLTEMVILAEHPRLWLANHLIYHTDRYGVLDLNEKYPMISKLVNFLNRTANLADPSYNEFKVYNSKKMRKRNRLKYQDVNIDYDSIDSYFENCSMLTDFQNGRLLKNEAWENSFSDLALHLIGNKYLT